MLIHIPFPFSPDLAKNERVLSRASMRTCRDDFLLDCVRLWNNSELLQTEFEESRWYSTPTFLAELQDVRWISRWAFSGLSQKHVDGVGPLGILLSISILRILKFTRCSMKTKYLTPSIRYSNEHSSKRTHGDCFRESLCSGQLYLDWSFWATCLSGRSIWFEIGPFSTSDFLVGFGLNGLPSFVIHFGLGCNTIEEDLLNR